MKTKEIKSFNDWWYIESLGTDVRVEEQIAGDWDSARRRIKAVFDAGYRPRVTPPRHATQKEIYELDCLFGAPPASL